MDRLKKAVGIKPRASDGSDGQLSGGLSTSLLSDADRNGEDGEGAAATSFIANSSSSNSSSGSGSGGGKARMSSTAGRASEDALVAQMKANEEFSENLKREEEQIYSEIRARRIIEEEDRKLAQRLQEELDGGAPLRIEIKVPPGMHGGSFVSVQIPGQHAFERVQIPPGLGPGDTFTYVSSSSSHSPGDAASNSNENTRNLRVRVPPGVRGGQTFAVDLPDGSRISVIAPENVRTNDEIEIPIDASIYSAQQQQHQQPPAPPPVMTEQERREREEFLAALPDDIRAEILAQEQQQQQQHSNSNTASNANSNSNSNNNSDNRNNWLDMVQLEIPAGVYAGQHFRAVMPDGRTVLVMVPPGFNPGDTLGIPRNEGLDEQSQGQAQTTTTNTSSSSSSQNEASEISQREREEFLAALPDDVRAEVLAAEQAQGGGSANTQQIQNDQNQHQEERQDEEEQTVDLLGTNDTEPQPSSSSSSSDLLTEFTDVSPPPSTDAVNLLDPTPSQNIGGNEDLLAPSITASDSPSAANDLLSLSSTEPQIQDKSQTFSHPPAPVLANSSYSSSATPTPTPAPAPFEGNSSSAFAFMQQDSSGVTSDIGGNEQQIPEPPAPAAAEEDSFASLSTATQQAMQQTSTKPPVERLKEAKAQLDKGEISQEEFEKIKKEVIAAI